MAFQGPIVPNRFNWPFLVGRALHAGDGLPGDLVAAEQDGLLPVIGVGIELSAHGGPYRPRLLAERIAVLVQPMVGPEGLLSSFAVERALFQGAHGEPRLRL